MRKILILTICSFVLTGCSQAVNLEAAEFANDPSCAEVSVRLPDQIGEFSQRYTNAQATSAWGEPTAILFRCGLEPVMVSALPCVTASEVDWLVDETNAPSFRFISFGTTPAVEVIVDSEQASGATALDSVAQAVMKLPVSAKCTVATE
jgi:hypothetical protein